MHLYEITSDYRNLLARVDDEDGVLDETLEADLDAIAGDLATKTDACAVIMAELDADAAALKAEEQRLARRRKAVEANRERLANYVVRCLAGADIRKVQGARFTVSLRASESVVVDCDPTHLPEALRREKLVVEPDKAAIKAALKLGTAIAGCSIVTRDSLQVK